MKGTCTLHTYVAIIIGEKRAFLVIELPAFKVYNAMHAEKCTLFKATYVVFGGRLIEARLIEARLTEARLTEAWLIEAP